MIHVKVCHNKMVDSFQAGDAGCNLVNARGVPASGIPGVHKHRFALRRHHKRRPSALGVYPINFERLCCLRRLQDPETDGGEQDGRPDGQSVRGVLHRGCGWTATIRNVAS